ncbi:MAG TPA: nuclear transport factor 2 family protein [Solirubrobacterales bacterium]|nr:nuclear transport factor 2 family protein [Solirubrobacterales bacterium]
MAGSHEEAVRIVYDGWARGDFRAGLDVFDPDVEFVMGRGFPEAGTYRGTEELARYTRGFLEPWSQVAIELEDLVSAGDNLLAAVRQHGVGGGSGAATDFRYFQVWTFRDGRVFRLENFRERAAAAAAAGLEA